MIMLSEQFDDIYDAHFNLSSQKNLQEIIEKEGFISTREHYNIEAAKRTLKDAVDYWYGKDGNCDGFEGHEASADRWLKNERVQMWLNGINDEHAGDCTAYACSCIRCHMENILGINTFPFSKHVGHALRSIYFEDIATPEQKALAAAERADYERKYPNTYKLTPDEATLSRWAKSEAAANEAYARHKALYAEQEYVNALLKESEMRV